jgi:hypothetical protein
LDSKAFRTMLAPKIAKSNPRAAECSASKLAPSSSMLVGHRLGHDSIQQALLLQRAIGNQVTPLLPPRRDSSEPRTQEEQEAQSASRTTSGVSWNFSKMPLFPCGQAEPSSLPGVIATAKAIRQATVESRAATPPTPADFIAVLGQVRMHHDASADRSTRLLGAEAVTFGGEILFRSDRYEPQTERGHALIAHELTHVAHQCQTGCFRPQRLVSGDVLSVQLTRAMAEAMTDDELSQQMNILRRHLQEKPDDAGAAQNLSVLESVAYDRQGTARQAPGPQAPAAANLSTTGADALEPGIVSATNVASDPNWVENDIASDQLSKQAPWTYTIVYKDTSKVVIPLEQVFMEPLPTATITVFRKHKASGRIIPCVLSQSDARLQALKGSGEANFPALAALATPRFDAKTAPKIVNLVNAAQMLFLGTGMLEVLQVQAMNPLMGGGMSAAGKAGGTVTKAAAGTATKLGGAAAKEGLTFVEIGAGDLKASIDLAKKGGIRVIAVDPVAPANSAVQELQGLGGQFIRGVAADVAPGTADHVFQYFPWKITGAGRAALPGTFSGTFSLVSDTIRLLKPGGAAHFVTEEYATAEYLAGEASKRGLRAVITKTAAGAAAPGASGAAVPNFSQALEVWMVNIYK